MRFRLFTCAPVLTTACSSGYSSGVDGSKPVSTLSASEAAIACENLSEYFIASFPPSERDRFNCFVVGLQEATPEACDAAFTACMVDPPTTFFNIEPADCTGATADSTCHATVSEAEACVTASVEANKARLGEVSCAVAGNVAELERLAAPVPQPSECTRLEATCPNVAGGEI